MDADAVVLDVDGVLVDTAESYLRAIIETIGAIYDATIDHDDVQAFKDAGGFNNDWVATDAIALFVLARQHGVDVDVPAFTAAIAERGGGLAAAEAVVESAVDAAAYASIKDAWDPTAHRRTFQWLYLGPARYRELEDEPDPAVAPEEAGFMDDEPILVAPETIERLEAHGPVGILTGRPRAEAAIALERVGLDVAPDRRLTMDDWDPGKPDPSGLCQIARACDTDRVLYAGDELDDVRTAVNADAVGPQTYIGIGVLTGGIDDPARFGEVGADAVLADVNDVPALLAGEPVNRLEDVATNPSE